MWLLWLLVPWLLLSSSLVNGNSYESHKNNFKVYYNNNPPTRRQYGKPLGAIKDLNWAGLAKLLQSKSDRVVKQWSRDSVLQGKDNVIILGPVNLNAIVEPKTLRTTQHNEEEDETLALRAGKKRKINTSRLETMSEARFPDIDPLDVFGKDAVDERHCQHGMNFRRLKSYSGGYMDCKIITDCNCVLESTYFCVTHIGYCILRKLPKIKDKPVKPTPIIHQNDSPENDFPTPSSPRPKLSTPTPIFWPSNDKIKDFWPINQKMRDEFEQVKEEAVDWHKLNEWRKPPGWQSLGSEPRVVGLCTNKGDTFWMDEPCSICVCLTNLAETICKVKDEAECEKYFSFGQENGLQGGLQSSKIDVKEIKESLDSLINLKWNFDAPEPLKKKKRKHKKHRGLKGGDCKPGSIIITPSEVNKGKCRECTCKKNVGFVCATLEENCSVPAASTTNARCIGNEIQPFDYGTIGRDPCFKCACEDSRLTCKLRHADDNNECLREVFHIMGPSAESRMKLIGEKKKIK